MAHTLMREDFSRRQTMLKAVPLEEKNPNCGRVLCVRCLLLQTQVPPSLIWSKTSSFQASNPMPISLRIRAAALV